MRATSLRKRVVVKSFALHATLLAALASTFIASISFGEQAISPSETSPTKKSSHENYPEGLILPWTIHGVLPEIVKKSETVLNDIKKRLASKLFTSGQPLFDFVNQKSIWSPSGIPISALVFARTTPSGILSTKKSALAAPVAFELVWSSLNDRYVVFVLTKDAVKNSILGASHTTISKKEWEAALKSKSLLQLLQPKIDKISDTSLARAEQHLQNDPSLKSALHIGFALRQETTRIQDGSSYTLNLLLCEQLSPTYVVTSPTGGEQLGTVRFLLKEPPSLMRPTRAVITTWNFPQNTSNQPKFPFTINLYMNFAESVLGSHIPSAYDANLKLELNLDESIALPLEGNLRSFLEGEAQSLALNAPIKVIKTFGAWAYLDKGRAFGLKINDRLIASSNISNQNAESVKGHIVGYYGADLGLTTPGGQKIYEGAIMFIRKGQPLVTIGQAFTFDSQKFPAPWPPQ